MQKKKTQPQKIIFGMKLGLSRTQAARLAALRTPAEVQEFVTAIPANYEVGGETCFSVVECLEENRAHCIEAAVVAACALWMQGRKPLLLDLKARLDDTDHVVTLFKEGAYWGAISKSNHVWLRWRDPVYRTVRELALSYFHEFTMGATKTLVAYSQPFDLSRLDPAMWVSGRAQTGASWDVAALLDHSPHKLLFPKGQLRHVRARDALELKAHKMVEYPRK